MAIDPNRRILYTDGACSGNPGPGGWAVVGQLEDQSVLNVGGEDETTNNRMELTGVLKAYSAAIMFGRTIGKRPNPTFVQIVSDSAYAVNAIQRRWVDGWKKSGWKTTAKAPVKNQDLWRKWIELEAMAFHTGIVIQMVKVKGHNGDLLNEQADDLARSESIARKKRLEACNDSND